MTKLEEILSKRFHVKIEDFSDSEIGICSQIEYEVHRTTNIPSRLRDAIYEYAEKYARKCLKLVDIEINVNENITRPTDNDFKLPEHK